MSGASSLRFNCYLDGMCKISNIIKLVALLSSAPTHPSPHPGVDWRVNQEESGTRTGKTRKHY
jgi:hypothetical protein